MSPRKSSNSQGAAAPVNYRKPRPDFYTVLLVIALVALLIGTLFLYLELNFYEMNVKAGPPVSFQQSTFTDRLAADTIVDCVGRAWL